MNRFAFLVLMGISFQVFSQSETERTQFNVEKKLALSGFDPVSYFSNKPLKGDSRYSAQYLGVVYHFASEQNKNTFLQNPSRYEPQYGGWCAYAMGLNGQKVEINPQTYKIIDGKLYLFYNAYFTNTLKSWEKDEKNLKSQADKNWSKLIKTK
jgi:YHS domain-containing protein